MESRRDLHLIAAASVVFLLLLHYYSVSAAPSSAGRIHHGNTHPALESVDLASNSHPKTTGIPPASLPPPPEETPSEPGVHHPGDPGPRSARASSAAAANRNDFYRPKRTTVGAEVHQSSKGELEHLVTNLKSQLRESQAAQVHTRSIINVLQEKVDAQENDLAILKNEISQLKRDQSTQRELTASLRSSTSDASWAIASVKRSQDQTSDDLRTLKRLQEHHNETLLIMEGVIMSSALELKGFNNHLASLQQDLFSLRSHMTDDRGKVNRLQEAVTQLQNLQKVRGGETEATGENVINESHSEITNHLLPYARQPPATEKQDRKQPAGPETTKEGSLTAVTSGSAEAKLSEYKMEMEETRGRLGDLGERVTVAENQLMIMSQRQMLDTQLLQLQQQFMNFTSQVYQLQQWRASKPEKAWSDDEYKTQYENDMASLVVYVESHTEKIRLLEDLAFEYRTVDQPVLQTLNRSLDRINASVAQVRAILEQPEKPTKKEEEIEGRVTSMVEGLRQTNDRIKDVELFVLNVSLSQCKSANEQLADDARTGNYVKQMADVQFKISEQTTSLARLDRGLAGVFQELDKNAAASSVLAEQLNELKKLSPEVDTMQRELLNFILQLPTDCSDVSESTGNDIHDGVYLIRPEMSRQSARTFCLVEDDVIWTVIQRRTDGRESFARSWDDYQSGFGDAGGEFWLGNDNIHRLTDGAHLYRLRIDMWDVLGRYWLADYASFRVHAEDALYRLELGEFSGNATDALRYSNLMPFSALDRDNDVSTTHCAQFYQSGWWYKHCHYSNLNGRYTAGMVWFHQGLDEWIQMKQTTMRISMVTNSDDDSKHISG